MTIETRFLVAFGSACALPLLAALSGCGSTPPRHCFTGSEIAIPAGDPSLPTLAIDFHMPDGSIVTRSIGDALPPRIVVPTNGTVTVIAGASDPQGVKDAQIFAHEGSCSRDPTNGAVSCSAPLSSSQPTASNPETNVVGQVGCTKRIVTQNLSIRRSATGENFFEVSAKGINLGGGDIETPIYKLGR